MLWYWPTPRLQNFSQIDNTQPWIHGTWETENIVLALWIVSKFFFFSKKAVWKKGSKIQNTYFKKSVETESQRQEWPRELSSFPLLNPENISWGKEVFKFSYQPMGGWGDFQDTDIQLKYLIIKVTYFPCYSFHHTHISLVLIHGIVIINVSNY